MLDFWFDPSWPVVLSRYKRTYVNIFLFKNKRGDERLFQMMMYFCLVLKACFEMKLYISVQFQKKKTLSRRENDCRFRRTGEEGRPEIIFWEKRFGIKIRKKGGDNFALAFFHIFHQLSPLFICFHYHVQFVM